MPLKFRVLKKEEVPAEAASLYVEREGAFVLDVEGAVEKARLDEFRNNNVALQKQLQELGQKFEGIDPERARALLEKQQELEDANLVKSGDVEKLVEKRLTVFKADLDKERTRANELQAQLESFTLNTNLQAVGARSGVRATALPDLHARAARVFKMANGKIIAFDSEGQVRHGKDGYTPLTLDEWVEDLRSEAPHLFETNSGGGAAGNGSGGVGGMNHGLKNPWKQETWNLTLQSKLARENPMLAKQLRAAAGR